MSRTRSSFCVVVQFPNILDMAFGSLLFQMGENRDEFQNYEGKLREEAGFIVCIY